MRSILALCKALESTISLSAVAEPSWYSSSSSSFSPSPSSPGSPPKGSLGKLLVGNGNLLEGRDEAPAPFRPCRWTGIGWRPCSTASTRFDIPSHLADKDWIASRMALLVFWVSTTTGWTDWRTGTETSSALSNAGRHLKQPNSPPVAHAFPVKKPRVDSQHPTRSSTFWSHYPYDQGFFHNLNIWKLEFAVDLILDQCHFILKSPQVIAQTKRLFGPCNDTLGTGFQPYSSTVGFAHMPYHEFPGQYLQDATHEFEIHAKDAELLLQLPQNLEDQLQDERSLIMQMQTWVEEDWATPSGPGEPSGVGPISKSREPLLAGFIETKFSHARLWWPKVYPDYLCGFCCPPYAQPKRLMNFYCQPGNQRRDFHRVWWQIHKWRTWISWIRWHQLPNPIPNCSFHTSPSGAVQPIWDKWYTDWYLDWSNHSTTKPKSFKIKLGKWSDCATNVQDKWSLWKLTGCFQTKMAQCKWKFGTWCGDIRIHLEIRKQNADIRIQGFRPIQNKYRRAKRVKCEKTMKVRGIGWWNASSKSDDARRIANWQIGRGNLQIKSLRTEIKSLRTDKEFQAKSKKWRRNCSHTTTRETGRTTLTATDESLKIWNMLQCVPGWLATIRMRITMIRNCTPQSRLLHVKNCSTLVAKFRCHLEIIVE